MTKYDILYTYIYERPLGFFEMADLEDIIQLKLKSEIITAETKEQAVEILKNKRQRIIEIKHIKEIKNEKFYNNGRNL